MRRLWILLALVLCGACSQFDAGGEMLLTVVPQQWVDLEVYNVGFYWSSTWDCGVEVHLRLRNNGNADSESFHVSLHDRRQPVNGLPAHAETTLILDVTGEELMDWMRATGMIDVDDAIEESDETNNTFDRPLPYSAVPGMESISICHMSQTPPSATWTTTAHPHPITNTPTPTHTPIPIRDSATLLAPSELPNLRLLSAQNTLLPFHCLEAVEGEFFRVLVSNNGGTDVDHFTVRIGEEDYEVGGLAVGAQKYVDVERPFGYMPSDSVEVIIDPLNAIEEANENDNSWAFTIMIFTPPVRCTPTFTPSPT